jgi:hypothetical protein
MDNEQVIANGKELNDCPDCGSPLHVEGSEHLGDGLMIREIYCKTCDFYGEEEFVISRTIRKSEKPDGVL